MTSTKTDLKKRALMAVRDYGVHLTLFRNAMNEWAGLNATDMECLRLLFLKGISTPSELAKHTGLTSGATTAMLDRLEKADLIINTAMAYSGVRYRYGGTTKKGMDCSGLLYVSFGENDIPLPRISYQMADEGKKIKLNKVTKGDLLFFKTSKKGKKINHVGLVVAVDGRDIRFIHATSSRGVIVSSLQEGFWNYAFVKATRVL